MVRRYAEGTDVDIPRSKAQIEKLLRNHGADGFVIGWSEQSGVEIVQCRLGGRMLRFRIEVPNPSDFVFSPGGIRRSDNEADKAAHKEHMRRWRALHLIVKAKLEIIAAGEASVDEEFMNVILLPDGRTLGEWAVPQIAEAYESGKMPPLLPSGED